MYDFSTVRLSFLF